VDVALDVVPECGGLNVGMAEVDARPDARLEHLVRQIREVMEDALLRRR
jgi:hypothetical protein